MIHKFLLIALLLISLGSTATGADIFNEALQSYSHSSSSIRHLIERGISSDRSSTKDSLFSKALILAEDDIASLWILYNIFDVNDLFEHRDRAISLIEKRMFSYGAVTIPEIYKQLMILAKKSLTNGDRERAVEYLDHGLLFAPNPAKHTLQSFFIDQKNIHKLPEKISGTLMEHEVQLTLLRTVWSFLKRTLIVGTLALLLLMLVKYFEQSVHLLTCLYPLSIPYSIRLLFITLLLLPLLILSPYVTAVFLTTLLIITVGAGANRKVMIAIYVGLMLFPITTIGDAFFLSNFSNRSSFNLFQRASSQIPSRELEQAIRRRVDKSISAPQRSQMLTALSWLLFKEERYSEAVDAIEESLDINSNSFYPKVFVPIIYRMVNRNSAAMDLFREVQSEFPESGVVHYNYNRATLEIRHIDYSSEDLRTATLKAPWITTYIDKNNRHFNTDDWPKTRRYIFSHIPPNYYWQNQKAFREDLTFKANSLWGDRFVNLPPLQTFLILLILLISLLVYLISSQNKRSKIRLCVLCGKPTCPKCRQLEICHSCNTHMEDLSNDTLIDNYKIKTSLQKRFNSRLTGLGMNAILPGSAAFYISSKPRLKAFPQLYISFAVYALYIEIPQYTLSFYPPYSGTIKFIAMLAILPYSLYFIVKFLLAIHKEHWSRKV